MNSPIYLDYAATTPVDPAVFQAMVPFLQADDGFGNPSSTMHGHGRRAQEAVEQARSSIAQLLRCSLGEIIFTSGATESNNTALKGVARARRDAGRHIVTMATEHKSVLEPCKTLEADGFEVTWLRPDASGLLDPNDLKDAIRDDTVLVSIMHVNNETGVIQDLKALADIVKRTRAVFHVDAAQSAGKLPIDWSALPIDLLSISAHKFYGPKGIGALVRRRRAGISIAPLIEGGGQESGLRSGTLPTHQIAGLGEAARVAAREMMNDGKHAERLRQAFLEELGSFVPFTVNGDEDHLIPAILNLSFLGLDAFAVLNALPDVSASASSACTTGTLEPSHVLRAMGIEGDRLYGAVRFSFGRFTAEEDVRRAARRVGAEVQRLSELAADSAA